MEDNNQKSREDGKLLRDAISFQKANEELLVESIAANALMYAERMKSLESNGFSRKEAMQIIIHRGLL